MADPENLLRLRRKHGEGHPLDVDANDGARLIRAQSFRNAFMASLIVFIVFCIGWVALTSLTGRVFPWMTVVLGYGTGIAIRRAGRGVDWRFPLLAGIGTLVGSVGSNFVLAASTTAAEYGTGTLDILGAVTAMTWPVFFEEIWNIGDSFFAVFSGGLAAVLAHRKLSRSEYYALRLWREGKRDD
ncbi:MAG: hypothetical protein QNJ14_14855 [Woeseiaceae bacterium]|nr:hypothetical protein [Woeseiaceae bacterium]